MSHSKAVRLANASPTWTPPSLPGQQQRHLARSIKHPIVGSGRLKGRPVPVAFGSPGRCCARRAGTVASDARGRVAMRDFE